MLATRVNKKYSYRSETALAGKQCKGKNERLKRRLEADEQEEVKINLLPKMLPEVSFSQFRFFACCLKQLAHTSATFSNTRSDTCVAHIMVQSFH
jgi:hypothetical protein